MNKQKCHRMNGIEMWMDLYRSEYAVSLLHLAFQQYRIDIVNAMKFHWGFWVKIIRTPTNVPAHDQNRCWLSIMRGENDNTIDKQYYRNACNIFRDGAPPCGPAGARNFINSTRTILHRNSKFIIIDIQTGATSMFVYGVSFIQQLCGIVHRCKMALNASVFGFVCVHGLDLIRIVKSHWMAMQAMQATFIIPIPAAIPLTTGHKRLHTAAHTGKQRKAVAANETKTLKKTGKLIRTKVTISHFY